MSAAMAAVAGKTVAAGAGGSEDPLALVHPELRPAARQIQAMSARFPPPAQETLIPWRKFVSGFGAPAAATPPVWRLAIKGPEGAPEVTIFVINAKPGAARPGIVHMHGGGFVGGSAESSVRQLQDLAATLDYGIVTVEYRLAPEATYAASVEDNYAGLRWLRDHAAEVGIDPAKIAVMGESAGGGHAALLAIAARDRGEIPLAFQMLIYPMLDDRTGSTHLPSGPIGKIGWDAKANAFGWRSFLGQAPGGAKVPAKAVPARTASLAGLPPTFIGVGSIDLFVDEDVDYAKRLIDAGVATELLVVPGAFHGFDGIASATAVAQQFAAAKISALRRAFA
ncbi:alpha/beta hydrolase [Caulobacter hibisci]|uniref:alpha/beta hydrolase n=1 Tax=Caulobacter hibisci TaxID=2035993 RepID=UPI002FCD6FCE